MRPLGHSGRGKGPSQSRWVSRRCASLMAQSAVKGEERNLVQVKRKRTYREHHKVGWRAIWDPESLDVGLSWV